MSKRNPLPDDLPLDQRLSAEASRFDFFQAVRLLERFALDSSASSADARSANVPLGEDGPVDREPVRFRSLPTLGFPVAPIASISQPALASSSEITIAGSAAKPPDMLVTFMGMAGASGVLPDHYTSLLIERLRHKDTGLRDFLDLFNHRLISLFYRAWEKYRVETNYERVKLAQRRETAPDSKPNRPWHGTDFFTSALLSLTGLGTVGLQNRTCINDESFAYYAGLFVRHPRNAGSLELLLNDYFGMPAAIKQFVGQWLPLAEEDRTRLQRRVAGDETGGFCQLGVSAVLGERVWDVQSKFRVRLGPLTYDQYCRLLPGGKGLRKVFELVRLYVGAEFDFDVQPVLKAAEVPKCQLVKDSRNVNEKTNRLGRNFWMGTQPVRKDFEGALFATYAA